MKHDHSPEQMAQGGIYRIKNNVTGHVYIGQASRPNGFLRRHSHHLWALQANRHDNHYLQNSWNKHGAGAFAFSIVLICRDAVLTQNEQWALDGIPPDLRYNQVGPVTSPNLGRKFSEEHRRKIGTGNKGKVRTPEMRASYSKAKTGIKFKTPRSAEHRRKLSNANTGRVQTAETRSKISKANTGKVRTPEMLERLRAAHARRKAKKETAS